jgi:hypothetical protein
VIEAFTSIVGVVNTILYKLIAFLIILTYFFLSTAVLMMFLNPDDPLKISLANAYVFSLFGGIGGDDFESYSYAGIAIVFGTLIVTVFLLNILIAYLSNVFSRLEDKQRSDDLKEKAQMVMDLEIIKYFFRNCCSKREVKENSDEPLLKDGNHEANKLNRFERKNTINSEENLDDLSSSKYLFIVEQLESDDTTEQTLDDNIYKKVKDLSVYLEKREMKINKNFEILKENQMKMQRESEHKSEEFKKQINENMKMQLSKMEQKADARIDKLESSINSLEKLIRELNK